MKCQPRFAPKRDLSTDESDGMASSMELGQEIYNCFENYEGSVGQVVAALLVNVDRVMHDMFLSYNMETEYKEWRDALMTVMADAHAKTANAIATR